MAHRDKLDARKIDKTAKKAALLRDLLGDDDEKDKDKEITEELTGIPQPPGEELTPVRRMPGAPRGLGEEVEEEYTPLSAEEIERKREEAKPPVEPPAEPGEERPRTFRDIMQDKLRKETPEGKKEEAMLEKYGPTENIKEVIDTLTPYTKQLAEVDIETAKTIIERSALPDILKERAAALFTSHSPGDLVKAEQLALNLLGAGTRKQVQDAEDWLRDDLEGQQYALKALEMHRTRRVMNMLSNTILAMEGEAVIERPKREPRPTPEQRAEKKRIEGLVELLNAGRITNPEFEDAKRKGQTADEVVAGWAIPPPESAEERAKKQLREAEKEVEKLRTRLSAGEISQEEFERERAKIFTRKRSALILRQVKLNMKKTAEVIEYVDEGRGPSLPQVVEDNFGPLNGQKAIYIQATNDPVVFLISDGPMESKKIAPERLPLPSEKFDLPGGLPPGIAHKLNMHKKAEAEGDVTGPGGPAWEYEWTSGLTPTKDTPQKRKRRFPFYNKPSTYTPGEGDQGNLHDVGPLGGQQDMNYLANAVKAMTKTADNDMFEIYSLEGKNGWITYTLFKKAHSKFRPGDVVVQYGSTPAECNTYRRRYGSIKKAQKSIYNALEPILALVVSKPSPDDTLHDLQKGKGEPGGAYGPRTSPYDQQPWHGNRDGFDAKNPPRQRVKRKFIPHMDQPDDESSGFLGGTMGSKKADFNPSAPVVETPEERTSIEQPPTKPINQDPKRPARPKKRYDRHEQNLTSSPNYMGEDSSGWDRERILLSMKKDAQPIPTYEQLQQGFQRGQITQEEFNQMVEYYGLAPTIPEVVIPEKIVPQDISEWTPPPSRGPGEPGRSFYGNKLLMKRISQDLPISSILNAIIQDVYAAGTLEEGREIARNHLLASQINEEDKQKMLFEIDRQSTLEALWRYLSNALLKYEGFGTI